MMLDDTEDRDENEEDPPLNGHDVVPVLHLPELIPDAQPMALYIGLEFGEVTTHQRLYCRHRRICLRIADERRWKSFSCNACTSFVPLSPQEISDETDALLHLLAVAKDQLDAEEARERARGGRP